MKYVYFKIFKFSTISKKVKRIGDAFSRIYKNIEFIPGSVADFFRSIAKYFLLRVYKNIKGIQGNAADFFSSIIKRGIPLINPIKSGLLV